ncbi:hypothetical protein ACFPP6_35880 [Streptomyces aureoversilis]|uniref:Transposase n=1 Tax=Streptomyces aureoversilis TaxID=67277 RepID=A0ABW0ACB4_9ACTN
MNEWQNRPLDSVYPLLFIDCVQVKLGWPDRKQADLHRARSLSHGHPRGSRTVGG